MNTLYRAVDTARNVLIVAIFGFIISIGAVQIVLRYSPNLKPLSWVDEIMRYLNIWVIFLAASIGVKESGHMRIEYFLKERFSVKTQKTIAKITAAVNIGVLAALIYYGFARVHENWNAMIQSLPISVSWFYLAIPVGSSLMAFEYILILANGTHPYLRRAEAAGKDQA